MAKAEKKIVANLTGKVELKSTFSQLRGPVDKAKERSRGPGQMGQLRDNVVIRIGNIPQDKLVKRLHMAKVLLETGKGPKAESGKEKILDLETKLEAANATILEQEAQLEGAGNTIMELTEAIASTPDPVVEVKEQPAPESGNPVDAEPPKEEKAAPAKKAEKKEK